MVAHAYNRSTLEAEAADSRQTWGGGKEEGMKERREDRETIL